MTWTPMSMSMSSSSVVVVVAARCAVGSARAARRAARGRVFCWRRKTVRGLGDGRAVAAIGDAAIGDAISSSSSSLGIRDVLERARCGDALRVTLEDATTPCYLECAADAARSVDGNDDGAVVVRGACRGVMMVLMRDGASGRVTLREDTGREEGATPRRGGRASASAFARAYDGWVTLLDGLARDGKYPAPEIGYDGVEVAAVSKLCDFDELRARVERDASFWADGSPVDFDGISSDERATLNAGEILAFACGKRPMCMVQLWSGWNANCATDQNVDKPFVMRLLKDMSEDGDVGVLTIAVPGGTEEHGLTALLYPNKSPYKERAKLLASIGVQAALVAGSPYYQTLIGRVLGYKEENIDAHVRQYNKGVGVSKVISDLVEQELAALSPVKVEHRTRWREGYESSQPKSSQNRRKKSKRSSSANVEDVEMMFGRRRGPR